MTLGRLLLAVAVLVGAVGVGRADDLAAFRDLVKRGEQARKERRYVDAEHLLRDAYGLTQGAAASTIPAAEAGAATRGFALAVKAVGLGSGEPAKFDWEKLWESEKHLAALAEVEPGAKDADLLTELADLRATMAPNQASYHEPLSRDAIAVAEKAVELAPRHPLAWQVIGKIRRDPGTTMHDPAAAQAALRKDVEINGSHEQSWVWLAELALAGDPKAGEAVAREGLGKLPDSAKLRLALGKAFEAQQNFATAADQYALAAGADPKHEETMQRWFGALQRTGAPPDKILDALKAFAQKHPQGWWADEFRVAVLRGTQKLDEAVEVLKEIATRFAEEKRGEVWEIMQADICADLGPAAEERLVSAVVRALSRNPKSEEALVRLRTKNGVPLMDAWIAAGEHAKVLAAVERLAGTMSADRGRWAERAAQYHRRAFDAALVLGKLDVAEKAIRRAMSLDDRSPDHLGAYALLLRYQGRQNDALAQWRDAIERRINYPWAWQGLGTTGIAMGQTAAARLALTQGLEWSRQEEAHSASDPEMAEAAAFESWKFRRYLTEAWRAERGK